MADIRLKRPKLHPAQHKIKAEASRFNVVDCGRRFGKSFLGEDLTIEPLLAGHPVGWFAPTYKILLDAWRDLVQFYLPVTARVSQTERRIELISGGVLEMWSLEDINAGRSRYYQRVILDEPAMVAKLEECWNDSIRPTLADLRGDAWFLSTPRGRNYFYALYQLGQDPLEPDWASWQRPTSANPFIAEEEIEAQRKGLPDRSFRQEWLAEFVQDGGGVFRGVEQIVMTGERATVPRMANRDYALGVDLAKYEDFTVLAVFDDTGRQVYFDRFNLVSWQIQIQRIVDVAALYSPLNVVIDATGVGDPVLEAVKREADSRGVSITLLGATEGSEGFKFSNTTKQQAIDRLAISVEQQAIRLMDHSVQTSELMAYQYELTPSGKLTMNAPNGMHDDCVIALALAEWGRSVVDRMIPVGIHTLGGEAPNIAVDYDSEEGWVTV